ncbi:MAG: peptide ABC transporter substrate-binding protein [Angelakisella sp.]
MNRLAAVLVALALLLVTGGCSKPKSVDIRMDLTGGVENLDPQFATDSVAQMLISNTMEGLVERQEDGSIALAAAESYTCSPDALRYTFTLRAGLKWEDERSLTAADFAFAFGRLFHWQVPSPYAERYLMIQNAPAVLQNQLPVSALGVRAVDDRTLEITLSRPSPHFLELLCEPAAMPCNQEFFESTRARYGLGAEYTLANGAFYLKQWDNASKLVLRPNRQYREPTPCNGLVFYTTRLDAPGRGMELFHQQKSDLYSAADKELEQIPQGASSLEVKNKVWQLVMNTASPPLTDRDLRRGLAMSLERNSILTRVPSIYALADSLIPPSVRGPGFLLPELLPYNAQWAKDSADKAYSQQGIDRAQSLTVLLPTDAGLEQLTAYLQKQWRDVLGVYVNMEVLPAAELRQRLESGKFSLALLPTEVSGQSPADVLEQFLPGNPHNYCRFGDPQLGELLMQAAGAASDQQAAGQYARAEQLIIEDAAAIPLLNQSEYLVFSEGTTGVALRGGLLIFKAAQRLD